MRRSKQSLSHYHLTTGNIGDLIPIACYPVLPGDVIGQHSNILTRVTPMAAPVMHQVDVEVRHINVPYRILWNDNDGTDWEEFITGGEDGMNADTVPTIASTATAGNLLDHLGVPLVAGIDINALPVRAYNMIYNELFRDQDLQTTKRSESDVTLAQVNWAGDYLTNAKPWSQKGPSVSLPVGDEAPVLGIGKANNTVWAAGPSATIYESNAATSTYADYQLISDSSADRTFAVEEDPDNANYPNIRADLSAATGADPIAFRRAWGLQRFMENAAKYGSRYPEKMRSLGSRYRGVMERPEILGGGRSAMNFSEVLQTANDTTDRDFGVGDMYGHGIDAQRTNKFARRIDEHGIIMTLMFVRPKPIYMHSLHREWLRQDREDFHDPFLEDIGMQEIYDNEVYAVDNAASSSVFGYGPRYEEYRTHPSSVSGEFRSTLDYWHLARKFASAPSLNSAFKTCDGSTAAMKRIFNEQTQNSLWIMAHHRIAAHRNISKRAEARLS